MVNELAHYLRTGFTKGGAEEIAFRTKNVKSEETILKIKNEILYQRYIIFDIETDTSSDRILRNNFDEDKSESSSLEIHSPNHLEYDVLQIDEEMTHEYDKCLITSSSFYGYNCVDDFCEWLFTEANRNTTVMAHNGAGYDFKFILHWRITKKHLLPSSFIRQGSRITYRTFQKYRMRFVVSYNFFMESLKKLPET